MARQLKSTSSIKVDKKYAKSDESRELFPFPNRDISSMEKDDLYHKKWAEAIYSIFLSSEASWGITEHGEYERQRLYALGKQSVEKYKKYLLDEERDDEDGSYVSIDDMPINRIAKREGWLNVLWENLSIGPKLMDSMHGMFDTVDFDLYVDAIDPNSMNLTENTKYRALVEGQNAEWQAQYKKKAGIPIDENVILPKSNQELAAIEQQGGFKLNIAKGMQKLARHSFNVSRWEDVIKKKIVGDLVTIAKCAVRDRYDQEDGMFKTEYLDPARLVIQHSDENDYNDAEYGGYFRLITIADLKRRMPTLSDEQLRGLAKNNQGIFGNPVTRNSGHWNDLMETKRDNQLNYPWYDFKVCVFEAEWIDWDVKMFKEYTTTKGDYRCEEISPETKMAKKDYDKMRTSIWRGVRQCTWVVGTNHILPDYGKVYMGARPIPKVPKLSIHVEQLHGPSIVERAIPIMDQISNLWFKYQNSMAKMIESGFAVDMGMLLNLSDGEGKKYPVGEVLKMWKQTGILPYMPSRYGNYQGGAVTPVHPLPSDFMDKLNGITAAFEMQFRLFEQVTGINPITLGQSPSPDAPVATTEASMQATSNIIKPIATAIFELKQNTGECLVSRIQTGIRVSEPVRKAYAGVIGENDINVIRLAEQNSVRYGLSMRAKPDQLFKQKLVSYIEIALASGRDGNAGIEIGDALLLEEKLWRGGDISDVRNELTWLIERRKQAMSLEKEALIKAQAQENQRLEMRQQQGAAAQHKMEMEKIFVSEGEKRKTERLKANTAFLQSLVDQANEEKATGSISDGTFDRLRIAMNIAGRFGDLSTMDLPAEVGRAEQYMASNPLSQKSNAAPVEPQV
jgi:hypothetical protein